MALVFRWFCPGYIRTSYTRNSLTDDGQPYKRVDESLRKGMPVDQLTGVRRLFSTASPEREEFSVGGKECLALFISRLFPTIFSGLVSRATIK